MNDCKVTISVHSIQSYRGQILNLSPFCELCVLCG